MFENEVKARVINFLFRNRSSTDMILVSELRYADGKRRADLATIGEGIDAFEIKGDKDNLDKLDAQVKDYRRHFNAVYVACTRKHLSEVRKLKRSIGIILVSELETKLIRKPYKKKIVKSKYAVDFFDRNHFEKNYRSCFRSAKKLNKKIGLSDMKKMVERKVKEETLFEDAIDFLSKKYFKQYEAFLLEKGDVTVEDDLLLLKNLAEDIY